MRENELKAAAIGILIYLNWAEGNAEPEFDAEGLTVEADVNLECLVRTLQICRRLDIEFLCLEKACMRGAVMMTPDEYAKERKRQQNAERQRKYRQAHPDRVKSYEAKRYARDRKKRIQAQTEYMRKMREQDKIFPPKDGETVD